MSTEDRQDPKSSRAWQHARGQALIEPHGGQIVAEFFDIGKSRSIPPQRRPEASRLIAALADPNRGFDAVVVGEPQWAFYGNQFGNTLSLFAHFGVPLWVPEMGGPIDPDNEAHDLIMSMFGGVSKGERNRIRVRVRAAMATQAQIEGRYLGGRPPYGYVLADAGPHPNPAKAADGKRLHVLAIDEPAAEVVRRIFAEFLAGRGVYAIGEHLTRDGIACPPAHDPARNRHRCGIAWNKFAVRAILTNPRYTGRQVWNGQRKDEVLIDVRDVALGHMTKMRWNDQDQWIYSDDPAHPATIDQETFRRAEELVTARRGPPGEHKPHRSRHDYVLRGLLYCGICKRRMQGHWANAMAYYRCRFPATTPWLSGKFDAHHLAATIDELVAATAGDHEQPAGDSEIATKIADCDRKLAQYRATLDVGAEPASLVRWITETETQRASYEAVRPAVPPPGRPRMTNDQIAAIVNDLSDVLGVLRDAEPADKADIYTRLGLRLTYQPADLTVRTEVNVMSAAQHWSFDSVRGRTWRQ